MAGKNGRTRIAPRRTAVGEVGPSPTGRDLLLDRLRDAIGPDRVVTDPAALAGLSRDMYRDTRAVHTGTPAAQLPLAVVRPAATEEVAAVVRIAAEARVPIVEFGGGTGLMGGARTVLQGLVLDLRSLNRVLAISAEDRTAHVEAGVVLADLGRQLEPHGLITGHDPWTFPIATVGGTISTNGLGYLGARYGSMGDQVLGLTVVLPGGEVVRTRPVPRSSTGPRLRSLWIGAEGTLGIITEAVLRVFPRPEATELVAFHFPGFDEGFRAIQALFAAGITPAMTDFGQTYAGSRLTDRPTTPDGAKGLLNLAFQGLEEEVKAVSRRTETLLRAAGGRRLPPREARRFWQDRHVVAEQIRARQLAPLNEREDWLPGGVLFDFIHVALPPSVVLEFKRRSMPLLLDRGISIGEWGLWNQPELFSMSLFFRASSPGDGERFAQGVDAALRLAQELGGSMEYCHGAGLKLARLMDAEHGTGMQVLRALKRALDPDGLLNPDKLGL